MMFIWSSEYLKQWSNGYIIVNAKDINEARERALGSFLERISKSYLGEMYMEYEDQDDADSLIESYRTFVRDIGKRPKITNCIFIEGSE